MEIVSKLNRTLDAIERLRDQMKREMDDYDVRMDILKNEWSEHLNTLRGELNKVEAELTADGSDAALNLLDEVLTSDPGEIEYYEFTVSMEDGEISYRRDCLKTLGSHLHD